MITFWLLTLPLLAAAAFFVWMPIHATARQRAQQEPEPSRDRLSLAAYQSRIRELDAEFQRGDINDNEYDRLKLEVQRRLLSDAETSDEPRQAADQQKPWVLAASMVLLLVVSSVMLYQHLGASQGLEDKLWRESFVSRMQALGPEEKLTLMEQEARRRPQDMSLWRALADIYERSGLGAKAISAYQHIIAKHPDDSGALARYAQLLFMVEGQQMSERIESMAKRSVALNPENITALSLLGIAASEREDYRSTIDYWQRVVTIRPEGAGADALRMGIAQAKAKLGEAPGGESSEAADKNAGVILSLEINLADALRERVSADQTLFVFAKAVNGPPMPLAVQKLKVADWPRQLVLDDSMAMVPGMNLSAFKEVEVVARISSSSQPTAQSGDLQGLIRVATAGHEKRLNILVDQVVE